MTFLELLFSRWGSKNPWCGGKSLKVGLTRFYLSVTSYQLRVPPDTSSPHLLKIVTFWDFPGGPVVKTLASIAGGMGLIPDRGTKILKAARPLYHSYRPGLL